MSKTTKIALGLGAGYLAVGLGVWLARRAARAEYCASNPDTCPQLPSPAVALMWPIAVSASANA